MLNKEEQLILEQAINEYCNTTKSARSIAREFGFSKDKINIELHKRRLMRKKKDNSFDENYFDKINNSEKAYWLGFIYADGCVLNKVNCVEIDLKASDIEHLKKFKKCINFKGEIKLKTNALKDKTYEACRIRLFSSKLKHDLIKHGCTPKKSLTRKYPLINKKYNKDFIRGYFDGDGSVYSYMRKDCIKPTCALSIIGTLDFLTTVQKILIRESGVNEVKLYNDKVTVWEYKKAFNEALKVLHYLYDDSSVYLDRKFKKFMEFARGSKIGGSLL